MIKADIIAGARPNFVKAGPIYRAMKESKEFTPRFIHTGQHTSPLMSLDVYRAFGIDSPEVFLETGSIPGIECFCKMIKSYNLELVRDLPDIVLSLGDTDSAFAGAYVAKRNNLPVAHVESGTRSKMPFSVEENNRKMIDHISDLLFVPMEDAGDNLINEHVVGKMVNVGNVMIDSLKTITSSNDYRDVNCVDCEVLITVHRSENVDNEESLNKIIKLVDSISEKYSVCFPVHPRTMNKLFSYSLSSDRNYFFPPFNYPKFLKTLSKSRVVLTDSGGVQVESCFMGVPCVVLSETTGWTNLLKLGAVKLGNTDIALDLIVDVMHDEKKLLFDIPMWDGKASERILEGIYDFIHSDL